MSGEDWLPNLRAPMPPPRSSNYSVESRSELGYREGCEAAVHAARSYVENMGADDVLVKLDFANAFNCIYLLHISVGCQQRLKDGSVKRSIFDGNCSD